MTRGERSVDRHGIVWETETWYANIVTRPFRTADQYARVLDAEILRLRRSAPGGTVLMYPHSHLDAADHRRTSPNPV
jgi:hypothetical protein